VSRLPTKNRPIECGNETITDAACRNIRFKA
jgi:hypothetical protein